MHACYCMLNYDYKCCNKRSCPPPSTSLLTNQQFINCAFLERTPHLVPHCVCLACTLTQAYVLALHDRCGVRAPRFSKKNAPLSASSSAKVDEPSNAQFHPWNDPSVVDPRFILTQQGQNKELYPILHIIGEYWIAVPPPTSSDPSRPQPKKRLRETKEQKSDFLGG